MEYRGDTPHKVKVRKMVWDQHKALLGDEFHRTPHVFLASQFAGDVGHLIGMGVDPDRVWAVENNHATVSALIPMQQRIGFRLFSQNVQDTLFHQKGIKSLYLDFCGHLKGRDTRNAIRESVAQLDQGSVVSITLFRGRESGVAKDREERLIKLLGQSTRHTVTLVQAVSYMSADSHTKGSPMSTWTFIFQDRDTTVQRVELGMPSEKACEDTARSNAAKKAWRTRRANALAQAAG